MKFDVLTPIKDRARWQRCVDMLPAKRRDIHFMPEYAAAQAMLGVEPRLAVLESDGGIIVQPFVMRPIETAPGIFDSASPYGYGGPVANVSDDTFRNQFFVELSAWRSANNVVDDYCVLHPFIESHQRWILDGVATVGEKKKDVVYIWLLPGFDNHYRRDRRVGIDRARMSGVTVENVEPAAANVRIFCDLYRETMLRKQAASRWYFPEEYLRAHFDMGGDLVSLFFARIDGEIEVASLVLHAHGTAYYHLTGNRMAHPKVGANDLLVHEVAIWAKANGFDRLHLGGGVTASPNDGVLEYKAGFSSYRAPVYSYFTIFDDARYNELCAAKRAQEIAALGREIESNFTPRYRAEAV